MVEKKRKSDEDKSENEQRPDAKKRARGEVSGRESIESMRERLYARGKGSERSKRSTLSQKIKDAAPIPRSWGGVQEPTPEPPPRSEQHSDVLQKIGNSTNSSRGTEADEPVAEKTDSNMKNTKKKHTYRTKLMLGGLVFFVLALALSSAFIWLGDNTISGQNIAIHISDEQLTVGGGEELSFQVSVTNQNAIPIDAATLIVNYPPGTQSAKNSGEELFSERIPLDVIESGEVVNVPLGAVIFGEENEERIIDAALEYRVRGSNATFFKEAEPLRLKISSSPVTLKIDTVERISSGQEMEFIVTVTSNSPNPLSNILVKASYPSGFDFTESSIETVSGQDTWRIEELEPESEATFTISGLVLGSGNEEKVFRFSVGVPNERDPFSLASNFSTISSDVQIEEPFLDIDIAVNGDPGGETIAIDTEETANIDITFTNTQDDTIFDGVIEARLNGNAVSEVDVVAANGYYDSTSNIATWDSVDVFGLSEIPPGQSSVVQLRLTPERDIARTPEITIDVTAKGERVYEDRVPQTLEGTMSRTIRIESSIDLSAEALYSVGAFTNTGPIPPVAEKITQYTLHFEVQNGSNDVTNAEVSAVLPPYVTWLDLKTPGDDIIYDAPTRTVTWDIGNMDANGREEASVQVSFVPSFSQVGDTVTLLEAARFRATDRFTGTVIRTNSLPLSTSLRNDPDEDTHDGRVQEED